MQSPTESNTKNESLPPPSSQVRSVDQVLAKELQSLSIAEREKVYEDVHGCSSAIPETPELLRRKLYEFDQCLQMIQDKPALYQAYRQNPDYVKSRRLMFLRAECFQPNEAAQRMVRYFQSKLEFWGVEKLTKRITMADFDAESREVFCASGSVQVLPSRDTSGRAVMFSTERYHRRHFRTKNPKVFNCRLIWYLLMTTIEDDEETQRNGIVYICYGLNFVPTLDEDERGVWWGCCAVANAMPFRFVGFHYCYNVPKLKPIISLISVGLGRNARCRMKTHYGTHQECQYALLAFGIPTNDLPVSIDGDLTKRYFIKWLERRRIIEAHPRMYLDRAVELPTNYDVLVGKGKPIQEHHGNRRFREIISMNCQRYTDTTTNAEKQRMYNEMFDVVRALPGRFLTRDRGNIWVEASDDAAKGKIAYSLRRQRRNNADNDVGIASSEYNNTNEDASASEIIDHGSAKRMKVSSDPIPTQSPTNAAALTTCFNFPTTAPYDASLMQRAALLAPPALAQRQKRQQPTGFTCNPCIDTKTVGPSQYNFNNNNDHER